MLRFTEEELRCAHNATWGDGWNDFQSIPECVQSYEELITFLISAKEAYNKEK